MAFSGEELFRGVVADFEALLQRSQPLPLGARLLLGCEEPLCDAELIAEYERAPSRPAAVVVLVDSELQGQLRFATRVQGNDVPSAWWSDRRFRFHACRAQPRLASWAYTACSGHGEEDEAFVRWLLKTRAEAARWVGLRNQAFWEEAVRANPEVYQFVPALFRGRYGDLSLRICSPVLRDRHHRLWRHLPISRAEVGAYLDALEAQPPPRRVQGEVWHTRAPPSFLLHIKASFAGPIRCNRELMLRLVARCWRDLRFAVPELRGDRVVVATAVASHWRALQYASAELRDDRALVAAALEQNGLALCFASQKLRADEALARLAVSRQRRALQYVASALRAKWLRAAGV